MGVALVGRKPARVIVVALAMVLLVVIAAWTDTPAGATSDGSPYDVPTVIDTNPAPDIVETTIVANEATVDIGNGVSANVQAFNGTVPGPEFRLNVGDTVIVHFKNQLDEVTGIHWHGIELANASDGTPLTQNQVPPNGSFLYRFKVTRPGIYWYHPHHHSSTNQVFKGLYGSIIVTDPNEAPLIADGVLPSASRTLTLALSDITVCDDPGDNDDVTYDASLPHVSGGALPAQAAPFPTTLCDTPIDDHGEALPGALEQGDVPNIQRGSAAQVNEGQTVLTNGVNVGGRGGSPEQPGLLANGAQTVNVRPGQGLRLQLLNTATTRFFRLRLTVKLSDDSVVDVPLVRIGGQGGLLDEAVIDTDLAAGNFDLKYEEGEVLLDPGDRADVVAAIPADATGVATLWTEDFRRTGQGYAKIPTVPVAHFSVTGSVVNPAYTIAAGTQLRAATGDEVEALSNVTQSLLDPDMFSPTKSGMASPDIQLTAAAGQHLGINGESGNHDFDDDYTEIPHELSARYAQLGDVLQLTVSNKTCAHHPFHLHGFSIQPLELTPAADPAMCAEYPAPVGSYEYATDFRDNIDVPPNYTLSFRVHLEDRPLMDGVTPGGGVGRWVFHCHIFFHAVFGMISEFVVVGPDGNEKPFVDVNGVSVAVDEGETATMTGTYLDPDEDDTVTLTASVGAVTKNANGTWSWSLATFDGPDESQTVYVTAKDASGLRSQVAFDLTVHNVAPTVTIAPNQVTELDEGDVLAVTATFTDPGADLHTATIDFGDGSGSHVATVNGTTVSGTRQYGDDGTFPVTVKVTDDDGASDSAGFSIDVSNVDPAVDIDTSGAQIVDGVPTIVIDAGVQVDFSVDVTDPGSDDLAVTWDFGDGPPAPDETTIWLVNPPNTDPDPSPSVQPRDITVDTSRTFGDACMYDVTAAASDDDVGSDSDSIAVSVFGNYEVARTPGWWATQFARPGQQFAGDLPDATLDCYLAMTRHLSTVFGDSVALNTHAQATTLLRPGLFDIPRRQLQALILTGWLDVVHGTLELNTPVDVDLDGELDETIHSMLLDAEAAYLDPTTSKGTLLRFKTVIDREILKDILLETLDNLI